MMIGYGTARPLGQSTKPLCLLYCKKYETSLTSTSHLYKILLVHSGPPSLGPDSGPRYSPGPRFGVKTGIPSLGIGIPEPRD